MPSLWRRSDEEMAKKDDDLPLANSARQHARRPSHWQATRIPRRRWVLRLVAYALFIAFLLFFLFQRFSDSHSLDGSSDVDNNAGAPHRHHDLPDHYPSFNAEHHSEPEPGPAWKETKKKPAKKKPIAVVDSHPNTGPAPPSTSPPPPFDGPIHFRNLAATLRRISSTGGSSFTNYNVLFAAASLRSAATLLPMACQMSQQRQSYVHFAFVGRSEIPLEELLEINGIDKSCSLIVHGILTSTPSPNLPRPINFPPLILLPCSRRSARLLVLLDGATDDSGRCPRLMFVTNFLLPLLP